MLSTIVTYLSHKVCSGCRPNEVHAGPMLTVH
jgi:hypothetical protein